MTIDQKTAEDFADAWIAAWNAHDLQRILSHYEDDFEMHSPLIVRVMKQPAGRLVGKESVANYWRKALERNPQLHFTKQHVLRGVDSITLIYKGVRGLSAEVFYFAPSGKVARAYAHYLDPEKA